LGIENFIEDALYKPNDYIGYHVGRRLAELHPEKSVVTGQTWYFDLENFVSDGHCSVIAEKTVFQETKTDRPSRFDRKYYFQLPADTERRAYLAKWNCELQNEMRVTEKGAARLVSQTQDFSFAYLKELLVASMIQWISLGGSRSMDEVILAQTDLLRKQISDSSRK